MRGLRQLAPTGRQAAQVLLALGLVVAALVAVTSRRPGAEDGPWGAEPEEPKKLDREALASLDWTGLLRGALAGATRLRVRAGGLCHRNQASEKTLLDTTDIARIRALIEGIQIDARRSGFSCGCCGHPSLEFFQGDKVVAEVGFHHGRGLRWKGWPGDGALTDESSSFVVQWMADNGINDPREEVEASRKAKEKSRAAMERWTAAMPPALRLVWGSKSPRWRNGVVAIPRDPPARSDATPSKGTGDPLVSPGLDRSGVESLEAFQSALLEALPDKSARILALLAWYSAGEGSWSGFPSYELIAETMLLQYSTEDIIAAADVPTLTEQQTEGAARYFAGWGFAVHRRGELKLLPPALRGHLLEHTSKSEDEDRRHRAQRAFGP